MTPEQNDDEAVLWGPFRLLVFREGEERAWLAQGVDYDLCVQAPTRDELVRRFWRHVAGEILTAVDLGIEPLNYHTAIPERFIIRYRRAAERAAERASPDQGENRTEPRRKMIAPSEVRLELPVPLIGTLERVERECAAALIVRACQLNGDRWQPVTPKMIGEALRADLDAGLEPWRSLDGNPFYRPDFHDLVRAGFAKGDLSPGSGIELTEDAIARIAARHGPRVSSGDRTP